MMDVQYARAVALTAQGFGRAAVGQPGRPQLRKLVSRLGLLQIDSVNVLQRAHYMPIYSRLGAFDTDLLHAAAYRNPRLVVESWAHEAAYLDVNLWQAMAFRRQNSKQVRNGPASIAAQRPELIDDVLEKVRMRGPVTARELEGEEKRDSSNWGWNWSDAKKALEYLFYNGQVLVSERNSSFERRYDLAERVLPQAVYSQPPLTSAEGHRVVVEHAVRALGVATELSIRDYFRLEPTPTRTALRELIEAGVIEQTTVEGWAKPAFHATGIRTARNLQVTTLLSPFDPLVFHRPRTEELFGFRYRIEIYVPRSQRVHGYYVLPFMYRNELSARVDLKADRSTGRLLVHSAFVENGAAEGCAEALAAELSRLAGWLELNQIVAPEIGDFATELTWALNRVIG